MDGLKKELGAKVGVLYLHSHPPDWQAHCSFFIIMPDFKCFVLEEKITRQIQ